VQISDQRQSFWTDVRKHKGRMRNVMLTAAPDVITARLKGKHEWPLADTLADHRRNIWSSMFKVDQATILFSHLMNAVDVEQMMDSDIPRNDEARDWAKGIFCHALDSKYRHRARCAGKLAKVKEWQTRLTPLQDPNRVTDYDEISQRGKNTKKPTFHYSQYFVDPHLKNHPTSPQSTLTSLSSTAPTNCSAISALGCSCIGTRQRSESAGVAKS
jgi:hypothetical protein